MAEAQVGVAQVGVWSLASTQHGEVWSTEYPVTFGRLRCEVSTVRIGPVAVKRYLVLWTLEDDERYVTVASAYYETLEMAVAAASGVLREALLRMAAAVLDEAVLPDGAGGRQR